MSIRIQSLCIVSMLVFALCTVVRADEVDLLTLFHSQRPAVREAMIAQLSARDHDATLAFLLAGLADSELSVRRQAVERLGQMRDTRAVPALTAALHDPALHDAAQDALDKCRDTQLAPEPDARRVERYLAAMRSTDASTRRQGIRQAIPLGNDPRLIQAYLSLTADADWGVQEEAITALIQIAPAQAIDPLITMLKSSVQGIRFQAAESLRRYGTDPRTVSALITALGDKDNGVQKQAIGSLTTLRDPRAVEPLIALLNTSNSEVRQAVIHALGTLGDARAITPLLRLFNDPAFTQHAEVFAALQQLHAPQLEAAVTAHVHSSDARLRQASMPELAELQPHTAMPALTAALKDGDAQVRKAAVEALWVLGDVHAIAPLAGLLQDADPEVCQTAAEALADFGDQRGISKLIALLRATHDPQEQLRNALVSAGIPAVMPVAALLHDDDPAIRHIAVWILGEIGSPRAVSPLTSALNDPLPSVRKEVIEALAEIASPRATDGLLPLLNDHDPEIRNAATEALRKIAPEELALATGGANLKSVDALLQQVDAGETSLYDTVSELQETDRSRVGRALLMALRRENRIAVSALSALATLALPETAPPLLELVRGPRLELRTPALEALCLIVRAHPEAAGLNGLAEAALAALADRDAGRRAAAAKLLGAMHASRAVTPLINALADSDALVSTVAAHALGEIGAAQAADALVRAVRNSDVRVRDSALIALCKLKDRRAIAPFLTALAAAHADIVEFSGTFATLFGAEVRPRVTEMLLALPYSEDGPNEGIITALAAQPDARVRQRLCEILLKRKPQVYFNYHDRAAAAECLGKRKDPTTIPLLITALGDPDPCVRDYVESALGEIGAPAVVPLLAALDDPRPDVRASICAALGEANDASAVPALIRCLHDSDVEVRAIAAWSLGMLKDAHALTPLLAAVRDVDLTVHYRARKALESLLTAPSATQQLAMALHHEDAAVRVGAAETLARLPALPEGVATALPALLGDADAGVQGAAAEAVGVHRINTAVDALCGLLTAPTPGVRAAAARALGRLGDSRAITPMHALLQDTDTTTRLAAIQALGELGHVQSFPTATWLAAELRATDAATQQATVTALAHIGPAATPSVCELLADQMPTVRLLAVQTLGGIGGDGAMKALTGLTTDADPAMQRAAVTALAQTRQPGIVDKLRPLLWDDDAELRTAVLHAMGGAGDPAALDPLCEVLRLGSDADRNTAIQALGALGDPRAIQPLLDTLPSNVTQQHAAKAVLQLLQHESCYE